MPENLSDSPKKILAVSRKAETRTQVSLIQLSCFPLTLKVKALSSQC